jgi:eukaryotic-like serine/threonine-protein kinase
MESSPVSRQMTSAQWQRVKDVTADALELEAAHRGSYAESACGDDAQVHREVLRLISEAEKSSEDFLADPPVRIGNILKLRELPLPYFSVGQIVANRFQILEFLNRGGMGEVYSAMDLELLDKVALKVIRPAISSSTAMIDRFKQEVRHTHRITHPNVCRVYDLFSHELPSGGQAWFLTMELLEGQTLGERIASGGPLPMKRALPLIRDMVNALAAAHDLGIVHRDFKPNNVMLVQSATGAERAVVTDFGLAANVDSHSRDAAGTPAYIAPEQAAGGAAGPAADQFSLGLVICEILTGKRPVLDRASATAADTELESWLSVQPRTLLSSYARSTIARCLAFQPKGRFGNVRDVVGALDGSKERRRKRWQTIGVTGAVVLTAITAVVASADWGDRVQVLQRLTPETDHSTSPSMSRDGRWVAYASNRAEAGNVDIWLESTRGGTARRLTTDPAEESEPSIAPNGSSVVFRSERNGGGIYSIGADAAGERLLIPNGRSPAFSPDGSRIAFWTGDPDDSAPSGQLFVTSPIGGAPRRLVPDFLVARYPAWSPDGQYLVFEGCPAESQSFPACNEFWITRTDGSAVVKTGAMSAFQAQGFELSLVSHSHQKAWHDGRIFFGARRATIDALWELPISKDMRASGTPRQVTFGEAREGGPSVAATGAIALGRLSGALRIWRIALDPAGEPARESKLTDAPFGECCPSATRDGRWLFFTRRIHDVKDLFRKDLSNGSESVILASPEEKAWPVPNESGTRIVFESRGGNKLSIQLIAPGEPSRTLCVGCSHPTSWFGGAAVFHTSPTGELALIDIGTGVRRAVQSGASGMTLGEADWNPDTEYLLFTASTNGANKQVYAVRFPKSAGSPQGPWILLTPESQIAEKPRWSEDGKRFYYLSNRDGYLCVWGQRFAPGEKGPIDQPFPVMHYHDYPRFSPNSAGYMSRGFSVARGSIFLNVGEEVETLWVGMLGPPSVASIFRELWASKPR